MRTAVARSVLRTEVQIEAGLSTAAGHDTQNAERINQYINRAQRYLEKKYTWPLEGTFVDIVLSADDQHVTFDPTMPFELVDYIEVAYGDQWVPLEYGITSLDRSIYGPNTRATPPRKWEVNKAVPGKFEVWPISAQSETFRVHGQTKITDMTDDADTCVLDADAIVLQAAGYILAKTNPDLAALAFKGAQDTVDAVLNRNVGRKIADGDMGRKRYRILRPGLDYIAPGS